MIHYVPAQALTTAMVPDNVNPSTCF